MASDLGLHCLPVSLLWDARHKWVKWVNSNCFVLNTEEMKSKIVKNSELNAKSVNPDQTPRSVASDLGLYCLPVSLVWDARTIVLF